MANLAATYWNQGQWDAAEELEMQVTGTRRKKPGVGHRDRLTSMTNMVSIYRNVGREAQAQEPDFMIVCIRVDGIPNLQQPLVIS